MAVGDPIDSSNAPPPKLSQAERGRRAKALSAGHRTELLVLEACRSAGSKTRHADHRRAVAASSRRSV
jgi:hypothetical protein